MAFSLEAPGGRSTAIRHTCRQEGRRGAGVGGSLVEAVARTGVESVGLPGVGGRWSVIPVLCEVPPSRRRACQAKRALVHRQYCHLSYILATSYYYYVCLTNTISELMDYFLSSPYNCYLLLYVCNCYLL